MMAASRQPSRWCFPWLFVSFTFLFFAAVSMAPRAVAQSTGGRIRGTLVAIGDDGKDNPVLVEQLLTLDGQRSDVREQRLINAAPTIPTAQAMSRYRRTCRLISGFRTGYSRLSARTHPPRTKLP